MALPSIINRLFSFTSFQQGQGDNSFPGTNIDADLDQTNTAVNALRTSLGGLLRSDGKLANGIVGRGALAADILLGVGPSKPWSASQAYTANVDTVTRGNRVFLAVTPSVGVDPLLDATGAYWLQTADLSQAVVVADGSIGTNAFADGGVTEPKLATGAVSNRALGAAVVSRDKAALNLGTVPVGAVLDYDGVNIPAGWLLCAGQEVARVTYPDLFAAITFPFQGNLTAGNPNVQIGSADFSGVGIGGAFVEGPGIPAGTVVNAASFGVVTLSNNATATGIFTIRLMPFGRGNGSTTFNVPDRRGRVTAGRDDMMGLVANRLTVLPGNRVGGVGGVDRCTLVAANLPSAMPGGQVTVSYPAHSYVRYDDLTTVSAGAGGTPVGNVWHNVSGQATVPPANQTFGVANSNPGGDQPFILTQPTSVANKIIFAGA